MVNFLFSLLSTSFFVVVITTIFDDDLHLFNALRLGAQGYLLKDNIDSNFIVALEDIVAGRPPCRSQRGRINCQADSR